MLVISPIANPPKLFFSFPGSLSSVKTSSRPVTPSHPPPSPVYISIKGSPESEISKLANKAEKILGLTPGTLAHAQACLENARDEVRRITLSPSPEPLSIITRTTSRRRILIWVEEALRERCKEEQEKQQVLLDWGQSIIRRSQVSCWRKEAKKRNIDGRKGEELPIASCTSKKKLFDWKNRIREHESEINEKGEGEIFSSVTNRY